MEKETPKMEIRLLLVIGFLLGATLGVGAGFGTAVALLANWMMGLAAAIGASLVGSIYILFICVVAIWSAHKQKELVLGAAADFFSGMAVGAFLLAGGGFVYGLGYALGFDLGGKLASLFSANSTVIGIISWLVGAIIGLGVVWAAWHLAKMFFAWVGKKIPSQPPNND